MDTYLDTNVVANLNFTDEFTAANDYTSTLVTTNKRHLDGKRPVAVHGVEVGVADTSELDIDENLIGAGLGNGDLLVFKLAADLFANLCPLHLGDLRSRHCGLISSWTRR
jgi:hypothetical protein